MRVRKGSCMRMRNLLTCWTVTKRVCTLNGSWGVEGQGLGLDCQGGYVPLERAEKFEKNIISSFQGAFKGKCISKEGSTPTCSKSQ